MATYKVLCIHGVGNHAPGEPGWQNVWRNSVRAGLNRFDPAADFEFRFVEYDHLFARNPPETGDYLRAIAELLAGRFGIGREAIAPPAARARDFSLRWTAGMVAQWVTNDNLRQATRQLLRDRVNEFQPDLIMGHSLGSLIAYDTLRMHRDDAASRQSLLITSGSQIGNPFVLNELGGRIEPLSVKYWFHLFNRKDRVFTAPLRLAAQNFEQVDAEFGNFFGLNHDLGKYLTHQNVVAGVWRTIAQAQPVRTVAVSREGVPVATERQPNRRALLIGINDYPSAENRLDGCVNDAYRLSAALQECGFVPDEIRMVLNDRATAQGIRDRISWLLDDARDGDVRFLSYSGHGAQLPVYGPNQEPDGFDECLVPYDFDWSDPATLVLDDWIYDLYSQLPYAAHFVMFLDCCHSGGMTRGGGPKIRTIAPPDDIRHRALRWDRELGMWMQRDFQPLIPVSKQPGWNVEDYVGSDRATRRLGRAVSLRRHSNEEYDKLRKAYDHQGPYLPMIMQACQENQVAFEYQDGANSFGAFTYCATKLLRDLARQDGTPPTFDRLCKQTSDLLRQIGYQQDPLIVGPDHLRQAQISFGPQLPLKRPTPGRPITRKAATATRKSAKRKSRR